MMGPVDLPLNVAVQGDTVIVLMQDGSEIGLTMSAAERSAQRLSDALVLAKGLHPLTGRDLAQGTFAINRVDGGPVGGLSAGMLPDRHEAYIGDVGGDADARHAADLAKVCSGRRTFNRFRAIEGRRCGWDNPVGDGASLHET
jgi:hypothetical protein